MTIIGTICEALTAVEKWDLKSRIILLNPADFDGILELNGPIKRCTPKDRPEWGVDAKFAGTLWEMAVITTPKVQRGAPEVLPEAGYTLVGFIQWDKSQIRERELEAELRAARRKVSRLEALAREVDDHIQEIKKKTEQGIADFFGISIGR